MISAIVLAAGLSRRMGSVKQLLPLRGGKSVIRVVVEEVRSSGVDEVIVVLGFRAEEIAENLSGSGARTVVNRDYESGMTSSVCCGMRAAVEAQSYLICLGDQPLVDAAIARAVIAVGRRTDSGIVIPTYEGKGGHPIFIDRRYTEEILQLGPDVGLNTFTRRHVGETLRLPVDDRHIVDDMDTPADYTRIVAGLGEATST